jgi:NH3-dependent NAD+ synthetase
VGSPGQNQKLVVHHYYTYLIKGIYEMSNLPGIKHKVIGLVSGGKDSTFNLLHCVANGHELVALATLTPEAGIGKSGRPSAVNYQSLS